MKMNKQELVTIIRTEVLLAKSSPERKRYIAGLEEAINIIEGFSNEPQKPVVPQFVADWYEENKDDFEGNLFRCAHNIPSTFDGAKLNEFERWFLNASIKAFQILVNMHQFGYEVEKEKRYLVKVKNVLTRQGALNRNKKSGRFIFSNPEENSLYDTKFTRKELEEAGFGWVFSCEGIEVEEVEE